MEWEIWVDCRVFRPGSVVTGFLGLGCGCSEVFVRLEANKKPTTEVMGFGYTTGPMVLVH